jgi:hypothetical protein
MRGVGGRVGGHNRVTPITSRAARGVERVPRHASGRLGLGRGGKGARGGRRARLQHRNRATLLGDGLNQSSHDGTSRRIALVDSSGTTTQGGWSWVGEENV